MAVTIALFLIATIASARLNRLIVNDTITFGMRDRIAQHPHRVAKFIHLIVHCVWCTGMYTAFTCAAYTHYLTHTPWTWLPLTGLAIAYTAPTLNNWLED